MKKCLLMCCTVMSFAALATPPLFDKGASEWSVVSGTNVVEQYAAKDNFWFSDTDPQHVTDDFWGQLGEFVKGGKTAVFVGYGEVPFGKIFKDVSVGKESFDYGKGRVILLAESPADEIAFLQGK